MKLIKNITIAYTAIMAVALVVILRLVNGYEIAMTSVGSYSNDELEMYKKVWGQMQSNIETAQKDVMICCLGFWAFVLVIGYLFIILVYITQIKPIKDMQSVATEISKGNLDVPLPMRRGNVYGGFTESFDLMREELRASKERELAAELAKREMMAELSHDIKTPVATIQATCEVMEMIYTKKREELQQESDNYNMGNKLQEVDSTLEKIGFISNKADTINQLVGNMFRATIDDMEEIRVASVEENSRIIEGFFDNLKEYGNIILDNHIPECLVYMDKLRMEQVVDNIVGNSYKYAGTDIHVSFDEVKDIPSKDGQRNNFIKIKISDNGPGVPEDELPLVVEKYYRGNDTKDKTGYGLGLYLVNWYMEKQGGGMEYYNDDGFVVELLVKKV